MTNNIIINTYESTSEFRITDEDKLILKIVNSYSIEERDIAVSEYESFLNDF